MKKKIASLILALVMCLSMLPFTALAAASDWDAKSLPAPTNLTAEITEDVDGIPCFLIKWTLPSQVRQIVDSLLEAEDAGEAGGNVLIVPEWKVGSANWAEIPGNDWGAVSGQGDYGDNAVNGGMVSAVTMYPQDYDETNDVADFKSETYQFRIKFFYTARVYNPDDAEDYVDYEAYSGLSNVATIGSPDYQVSSWAQTEVAKADDVGLIPDILKNADLTKPITREEFCELALLLYEKSTGKIAVAASPNPFKDTTNPQILKAYALGITTGTSATTFEPKTQINREQCATMLFRAIKAIVPNGNFSTASIKDFPDQKDISSFAVEATKFMSKLEIVKGDSKGYFMPKATTTAQQASGYGAATREAAILMSVRTYEKVR